MPSPTGIWSPEEAETGHVFDYKLAQWLGQTFQKDVPLVDLGCGTGTYLRYFHDIGFQELHGVEGTDLPGREFGNVFVGDLTEPIDLQMSGNVMCLEVAEHIPLQYTDIFLKNIVRHFDSDVSQRRWIALSWGIPGQDGLGHVNCQHNIWVIDHMRSRYNLILNTNLSLMARAMVSDYAHWLRDTLMFFQYYPT